VELVQKEEGQGYARESLRMLCGSQEDCAFLEGEVDNPFLDIVFPVMPLLQAEGLTDLPEHWHDTCIHAFLSKTHAKSHTARISQAVQYSTKHTCECLATSSPSRDPKYQVVYGGVMQPIIHKGPLKAE